MKMLEIGPRCPVGAFIVIINVAPDMTTHYDGFEKPFHLP